MLFLKSLTFILWNIALGWAILYLIKWFLFNRKPVFFFKRRFFLTPGFIVRKREWLFSYMRDFLHNYLEQAESHNHKDGYLTHWENKVHDFVWYKLKFLARAKYLPFSLGDKLRVFLSGLIKVLAKHFLRKVVPQLMEKFRLEFYIDKLDLRLSMDVAYYYYQRYIYRTLWYIFLALNILIGINNLIWYLLLGMLF